MKGSLDQCRACKSSTVIPSNTMYGYTRSMYSRRVRGDTSCMTIYIII